MTASSVVGSTPEGRDLPEGQTGELGCVDLVKLSKANCKVLQLAQGNPKHRHRLDGEWIESSSVEKDLGVLVNEQLSITVLSRLRKTNMF